jgi:DNA-binding HxlR family transcriptional regulator
MAHLHLLSLLVTGPFVDPMVEKIKWMDDFLKSASYAEVVRSYGQYCAMAKALDVIGDRWSLLIVRELMLREACRYTDLRQGLPGVASNLLVDRLRELEAAGIVSRGLAPPPIAAMVFRLTPRGQELRTVVHALGRWGGELMGPRSDGESFRSHWLALPFELYLTDRTPERPPVVLQVLSGDEPLVLDTVDGEVRTRSGAVEDPDAMVSGPPDLVLGLLAGRITLADARRRGLHYSGDPKVLSRIRPDHPKSEVGRRSTGS